MKSETVKVLYIAGYGRSGSTLLERMLGQIGDFVAVGELSHIWERGFIDNQLCGCGRPFRQCDFWRSVVVTAFGGFERVHASDMAALRYSVARLRYIPQLMLPWQAPTYQQGFQRYGEAVTQLYRAIRDVSRAKVVIDSSKDPRLIFFLRRLPGIDLHVLHLVRDSRAVAFSWSRKKIRPEITTRTTYMPTFRPMQSAWQWTWQNLLTELAGHTVRMNQRVRYEELVTWPRQTLSMILSAVGLGSLSLDFILDDHSIRLDTVNHTVAGNPMRFQSGIVQIRLDLEWQGQMPMSARRVVTSLTSPLLWRFRYPIAEKPVARDAETQTGCEPVMGSKAPPRT